MSSLLAPFSSREAFWQFAREMVPDTLKELWQLLLWAVLAGFVLQCINTFAQANRSRHDREAIQKLEA